MANPHDDGQPSDEVLVAYRDGELGAEESARLEARLAGDATLTARLDTLGPAPARFAEAFEPLLAAAPDERLNAKLAAALGEHATAPAWTRRPSLRVVAAAVVVFAVGAAAGYLAPVAVRPRPPQEAATQPNWREAVAGYQSLITSDSMAVISDDPATIGKELTAIGGKLSLDLSPAKLTLPDLDLKRVELFDYLQRPLAQIAYLSSDGPIAFCIIANGRPDEASAFEQRDGFNIVYWNKGGRGYLVIGHAPRVRLETLAGELAERVS